MVPALSMLAYLQRVGAEPFLLQYALGIFSTVVARLP